MPVRTVDIPCVPSCRARAAILTDALSFLDCEVVALHEAGDHVLVVGQVVDGGIVNYGEPLTTAASAGLRYQKFTPR